MTGAWIALATVGVTGIVVALVRHGAMVVRVIGDSMLPTLHDGDRLLAWRRRCRVGDVIVFRSPVDSANLDHLVKRVAAAPGDAVPSDLRVRVAADRVPAGHFLVRGDNPNSLDSRRIGFVPADALVAVVVTRLDSGGMRRTGSDHKGIRG